MIFFSYKIKGQVFCTNIPLSNSISFYNLYSCLKEIMKHLNLNKHLNGTHISVTSPHFKTVSWKSKAKLCYHNLPPWILHSLHACTHPHSDTVYIVALGDFLDGRCTNNMNKLHNN